MTTIEMIDLIRAGQASIGRRVLLQIADRLEAQELAMDGMMNSINAQEHLLRDMGGKLAESERHRQLLTVQNAELLARCDVLEAENMDLRAQSECIERCMINAFDQIIEVQSMMATTIMSQQQNRAELASIS